MSHANAALTPRARLRLARFVVEEGHPISQAAVRFEVSYRTAQRWVQRYLELGEAGMNDRSSRPHRTTKTPPKLVRKIMSLRRRKGWGPVEIGDALDLPASTVHAVLKRCRLNRLSHLDRITGERVRRYEHEHPGDLLHVDVKKLGNIPTAAAGATPAECRASSTGRRWPTPAWLPATGSTTPSGVYQGSWTGPLD